ncbi:hypothetical protein Tco_0217896 [Tanacetum coccineum]
MVNTLVVIALHGAWSSVVQLTFVVEGEIFDTDASLKFGLAIISFDSISNSLGYNTLDPRGTHSLSCRDKIEVKVVVVSAAVGWQVFMCQLVSSSGLMAQSNNDIGDGVGCDTSLVAVGSGLNLQAKALAAVVKDGRDEDE